MDDRFGLETAARLVGVELAQAQSDRLLSYVRLLRTWQAKHNLVSRDTLGDVWNRHVADSLQLLPLLRSWQRGLENSPALHATSLKGVDLGSGAGLPGAVLALAAGTLALDAGQATQTPQLQMTLVEATHRKGSFLRTVSRETQVPFDVLTVRLETITQDLAPPADFVTARALAPLAELVRLAAPWLQTGATAFFHKGGEYARELDQWPDAGQYNVVEHTSVVDVKSRILQITLGDTSSLNRDRPVS